MPSIQAHPAVTSLEYNVQTRKTTNPGSILRGKRMQFAEELDAKGVSM